MSPAAAQAETPLSGGTSVSVLRLNDNGSNWIDYKMKTLLLMGSKSLMGYIEGTAVPTKRYAKNSAGEFILNDGTTVATSDQIDIR
jgi:hypothetical protein